MEVTLKAYLDGTIDGGVGSYDVPTMRTSNAPSYCLIRFPENQIPVGAQILTARLSLMTSPAVIVDTGDVAVHRIKREWDQSVTLTTVGTPGAFFEMDGIGILIDLDTTHYDWEIRKIVQAWANGAGNNGLLIAGNTSADSADVEFWAREGAFAPELFVRYY